MARYLPVYLPRAYSTPSDPCVYVHALAVSLCNRTTGTRIPTSSLYFPAHKFISWKIGWPSCVGSAPRRRSPPISLAKTSKSSGNRSTFFTFVHGELESEWNTRAYSSTYFATFDEYRVGKKDYWKKRNWVRMEFAEKGID